MPITDDRAAGMTDKVVDPMRYDSSGLAIDGSESTGITLQLIPATSKVLDVGCGTGSVSVLIHETLQCRVVGIEPHVERAKVAQERGIDIIVAEFNEEVIQGLDEFDVVVFQDVLEHLVDPLSAIQLAKRVLRPGGCIVASVPNIAHWSVRLRLLFGHFEYQPSGIMDATHLRWFTDAGLRQLFASAGFSLIASEKSAGNWMPEYWGRPWRWMSEKRRISLVKRLVQKWPMLFGCQHIVKAVVMEL